MSAFRIKGEGPNLLDLVLEWMKDEYPSCQHFSHGMIVIRGPITVYVYVGAHRVVINSGDRYNRPNASVMAADPEFFSKMEFAINRHIKGYGRVQ